MPSYIDRLPRGAETDPGVLAKRAVDGILDAARGLDDLDALTALSGAASRELGRLDRELGRLEAGSLDGPGLVAKIREYERAERELRALVRAHPDHSYDGL